MLQFGCKRPSNHIDGLSFWTLPESGDYLNSAEYVDAQIAELKQSGESLQIVAWQVALLCIGWAYVYGAKGQECTPEYRRKRYSKDHPTIKTKCKNFDGNKTCSGCQWYPDNKRTKCFDCRGFTYWVLKQVFNWNLYGETTVTQWGHKENWKAQGLISAMPKDTLCCLFEYSDEKKKMIHTGFGFNNETVECQVGVEYYPTRKAKWTHYAVPKCIDGDLPPTPTPTPTKPTLRCGDSGEYVTLAQTKLIQKGYDCGSFGADGKFGAATEKAVREFQKTHTDENGNPLTVDGVIGSKTWWALDQAETPVKYAVTIPHLSKTQADALVRDYPGATMTEERGEYSVN